MSKVELMPPTPRMRRRKRAERLIDIVVATALLPVVAVTALVVMPLIRLESRGPALFRQVRVGKHEKPIAIYKFRTLVVDVREVATHELDAADVTRVGRILRAAKIDELPQLVNVLAGSMSLVGPRPCLPSQIEVIAERRRAGVFSVRPGITGWAQVAGVDMSTPLELAAIDRLWIESGSVSDNFRTMLATAPGPVRLNDSFPIASERDSTPAPGHAKPLSRE